MHSQVGLDYDTIASCIIFNTYRYRLASLKVCSFTLWKLDQQNNTVIIQSFHNPCFQPRKQLIPVFSLIMIVGCGCVNMCVYFLSAHLSSLMWPITVPVRTPTHTHIRVRTLILSLAKRQNGQLSDSSVPGICFLYGNKKRYGKERKHRKENKL